MALLGLACAAVQFRAVPSAPAGPTSNPATPPQVSGATSTVVGALGLPQAIDFEGNQSFSARALREGLAGWPEFLLAAHPAAPLADFLATIRQALTRGYHNAGFRDVRIELNPVSGQQKILVNVTEGPRFHRGEVRITGLKNVSATDIVRRLTEPHPKAPDRLAQAVETILEQQRAPKLRAEAEAKSEQLIQQMPSVNLGQPAANDAQVWMPNDSQAADVFWPRGKPAPLNNDYPQLAVREVRRILAELGHPLADLTASLKTDDTARLAHLVISVVEGPRAVIGTIEVVGHQRNTREDILKLIGLEPGMPATPDVLTRAKLALWNSARFYTFDLTPKPRPAPAREVDLTVEVDENEELPPVREPLARHQAALVRFANWMTIKATQHELAFVTTDTHQQSLIVAFSPSQGLALQTKGQSDEYMGLTIDGSGARAFASTRGRSARKEFGSPDTRFNVWLHFVTGADPEATGRRTGINFGAWFAGKSEGLTNVRKGLVDADLILTPACACLKLTTDSAPRFENGEVIFVTPTQRPMLRIKEDTGELIEWDLAATSDQVTKPGTKAVLRVARGEFEQIRKTIDTAWALPGATANSLAVLLLEQPLVRSMVQSNLSGLGVDFPDERMKVLAQLTERVIDLPEVRSWFSGEKKPDDPAFVIPEDPSVLNETSLLARLLGASFYRLAVMLWPVDTWPAKLTRELFYILAGQTKYTPVVMEELYQDPRMGPLGSVVTAQLLRKSNPSLAWRFARRALEHRTQEDFRKDWRMLLDPRSPITGIARDLLRFLGDLTDEEMNALTASLPDSEAALLQRAVTQMRQQREQPAEDVLQGYLDEWWVKNMLPDLENRVGAMMAPGPVDPAIDAVTVNGLAVSRKFVNRLTNNPSEAAWIPQRVRVAGTPESPPQERALDALVKLTLVQSDFLARGGTIQEESIDQLIAQIVQGQHGGNRRAYEASLASQGLTPADNRELLRQAQIFGYMTNQEMSQSPAPSEEEISQLLAVAPPVQDYRHLRIIGVRKSSNSPEQGRARAEAIRSQALADGTFDKVWATSDPADSPALQRINMPKVKRIDMSKEVGDAAFALELQAVSAVTESGDLFLVINRVPIKAVPPGELRRQAAAQLAQQKQREAVPAYLERLRANAIVRTLADPALTASNLVTAKAGTIRLEFESIPVTSAEGINLVSQPVKPSDAARWSEGQQALCQGKTGNWCEWSFTVTAEDEYQLNLFGTRAPNFGQVQVSVDEKNLGVPVEFFAPRLQPTGIMPLGRLHLKPGTHRFRCTITGQHLSSLGYQFGLDALDLVPLNPSQH